MTDLEARIRYLEQIGLRLRSRLRAAEDDAGLLLQQVGEMARAGAVKPPTSAGKVLIWTGGTVNGPLTSYANAQGIWQSAGATVDILASGTPTLADYQLIFLPGPTTTSPAMVADLGTWVQGTGRRLLLTGDFRGPISGSSFAATDNKIDTMLSGWSVPLATVTTAPTDIIANAFGSAESDPLTAGQTLGIHFGSAVKVSGGTPLSKYLGSTWLTHAYRTGGGADVVLGGDLNAFQDLAGDNSSLIANLFTVPA